MFLRALPAPTRESLFRSLRQQLPRQTAIKALGLHFETTSIMPTTATAAKTNKRKSDASTTGTSKKQKSSSADSHVAAKALVATILAAPESYVPPVDDADALRAMFVELAEYAKSLETLASQALQTASNGTAVKSKSPEQIRAEAERLASTINSGIKKQMSVSAICARKMMLFRLLSFLFRYYIALVDGY